MTGKAREYRRDMFSEAFESHPMAGQIKAIAAEHDIDLTDVQSLSTVLQMIEGAENSDPKLILFCALLLERLVHYKEEMSIKRLMETDYPNISQEENESSEDI
jgi:hypothetical protein